MLRYYAWKYSPAEELFPLHIYCHLLPPVDPTWPGNAPLWPEIRPSLIHANVMRKVDNKTLSEMKWIALAIMKKIAQADR